MIEYAQYVENYYGTPKAYVEKQLAAGRDVILEIEIQGALKVKEKMPDTLLMFVTPPSAMELKRRLTDRGTETPEVIESRLRRHPRKPRECRFMIMCSSMTIWKNALTGCTALFKASTTL